MFDYYRSFAADPQGAVAAAGDRGFARRERDELGREELPVLAMQLLDRRQVQFSEVVRRDFPSLTRQQLKLHIAEHREALFPYFFQGRGRDSVVQETFVLSNWVEPMLQLMQRTLLGPSAAEKESEVLLLGNPSGRTQQAWQPLPIPRFAFELGINKLLNLVLAPLHEQRETVTCCGKNACAIS